MDELVPRPDADLIVPMTLETGTGAVAAPARPPRHRLSWWLVAALAIALILLGGALAIARRGTDDHRVAQARHDEAQRALDDQTGDTETIDKRLASVHDRMVELDDSVQPAVGALSDVSRVAGEDADLSNQVEQALRSSAPFTYDRLVDPANAKLKELDDAVAALYALLAKVPNRSTVTFVH